MNKHLHRIIFNTTRGMRMVVQETASSAGKGQSRATTAGYADGDAAGTGATSFALTILGLAILLSAPWAHAQIVASPLAPAGQRATVLVAPNGVPLVNITTPSAAGVSRNVYSQFDVNAPGVILNNSRTTVQTQLGGYVQGNPWLATGPARIILNEVNGGNPSQLRGYVEVGGQRAEVVIANPAGINVDGGGFINASRATLTTGTPQLGALGSLQGFVVNGGTVSINGAGLDASKTDYAAILSRALQVNAAIYATDLKVVTGANQISADHSQIIPITGATTTTGAAPTFALDVSQLGGMYAGKIVLIGTQAGLGVRNAGSLGASAGSLVVTAAGRLENTGTLQASDQAKLSAAAIANSGTVTAGTTLVANATQGDLSNNLNGTGGTLQAQSVVLGATGDFHNEHGMIRQTSAASLTLSAPTLSNTNGGVIGLAPVAGTNGSSTNGSSTPGSTATGTPSGGTTTATSGTGTGTGTGTTGTAGSTGTTPAYVPPTPGTITAGGTVFNDAGKVYAAGPVTLQTAKLSNTGGSLNVASMALNQPTFDNHGGTLNVSGAFSANLGQLDNSGGVLHAGSLSIDTTGDLRNVGGTLTSDTDASLTVGGTLDNTRGTISAVGALSANVAGAVTNTAGTLLANQALTLSAQSLDNAAKGSIQSSQAGVQLAIVQQLVNGDGSGTGTGVIAAATDLGIQAGSLASSGSLRGGNDTGIAVSGALVNNGTITAGRNTTVTAGSVQGGAASVFGAGVQNDGTLAASGDLHITARQGLTALGTNLAAGNSVLQGASIDLSGSKTSAANIGLSASAGDVVTRQATVVTPGTLGITAHAQPGQTLVNDAGSLNAGQLDLRASNIVNTNGGAIVQTGVVATSLATTIAVTGTLNNDGGQIAVNSQDLTLSGASITNAGGKIVHAGSGTLTVAGGSFGGANGSITGNGALVVSLTGGFAQDSGTTSAKQITIDAGSLSNRSGKIVQSGTDATRITVVGALDNTSGTLASNGQDMSLSGAAILNTAGQIQHVGSGTLGIAGGSFAGTNGQITGNGALVVNMANGFVQDSGTTSAKQVTVDAGSLSNRVGGQIVQTGTGATRITVSGALDNTSGTLASNGQDMSLSGATILNTAGQIQHAGSGTLGIAGGSFAGTNGQITSNGGLVVNMTGAFAQDSGTTSAKQITVDAGSLSNRGGKIVQTGTGATRIAVSGALDNTSGTLASNGATNIAAGSLTNQGGSIRAAGTSDLGITTTGLLDNSAKGQIAAGGNAVLRAGDLHNDAGSLTAVGTLGVTVSGAASNTGGTIAANGNTSVASASLDNTQGTVTAVNGNLAVTTSGTTSGTTTNAGGTLQSGGATTLVNGGLDNTAGKVTGHALSIDTQGQRLNNTQGTLAGTATVDLRTGALVNTAGLIQSGGAMTVDTHGQALTNNNAAGYANGQGGIASADTLSLATGALDNTAGFIGAKKALTASTQGFSNGGGGLVVGQSTVAINTHGATYDNTGGQTQAVGALTVNAGDIANTGGLLRSSGTTTLNAGTIVNAGTQGTNQGIEGANVVLNVGNLNNQAGAVRADRNVTVTSSGTVDNSNGGLLSAGDTLKVVDPNAANPAVNPTTKTLSITNTNGRLVGGTAAVLNPDGSVRTAGYGAVQLDAKTYSADGQLVSGNDIGVRLVGDVTNNVDVSANGNLTYATTGNLTNSGKLLAGGTVTASGNDVSNTATGEIHGDTTIVSAVGALTNRGLIDGHDTRLNGSTVNNLGTGRIYGDTISIGAGTLNNDTETVSGVVSAGTIAARDALDIGAGTINNREHAYIFSAGDMFIGGALNANRFAVGSGGTLNNLSARIESLGDVNIAMGAINNFDTHLTVRKTSSTTHTVQLATLDGKFWSPTDTFGDPSTRLVYHTDVNGIVSIVGKGWGDWYNTIGTTADVASNADPARIVAGGNMTLVGHLHNRDSKVVAGGTLTANDVDNESSQGTSTTTVNTVYIGYNPNRPGKPPESPLSLSPVVTTTSYPVGGYEYASNTNTNAVSGSAPATTSRVGVSGPGGTTGTVASSHPGTIVEVPANVGGVGKTAGSTAGSASGTNASASGASTATSANAASGTASTSSQSVPMVVRTSTPELTVPQASLFRTLPGAASHYLIETDPRFANYRTWLSSDYLLAQFELDPNNTLKRLGDGFYEQKLIRDQVAQLTGYRYVEGFSNDQDEYTALMSAGVTFAKQYNLSVGVALSAAQMAQLTSDIVWLVEQTVTLPDGSTQRVLVPQVYVRVRPGDIDGSGALLSADSTVIKGSGDLVNTGTIAGRTLVSINADSVNNLAGGRISGASVGITAVGDIDNIGGTLDARDKLTLDAGGDINIRTTTQSTVSGSNIDRVAGLYVSDPRGTLVASAGHDFNLAGAVLSNQGTGGSTSISAKNDINLSTVTTGRTVTGTGKGVSTLTSESSEHGSTIATNGTTVLNAGRDVNARQATVDAGASLLSVHAARDINIESGQTQTSSSYAANWTDKGLFSNTANALTANNATRTSVGSTFSGGMVSLGAGNDINIEGSHIGGTAGVLLVAGNNLNVVEGRDTASANMSSSRRTSGFGLLGGFIPVAVPVKKGATTGVDIQTDTALASTLSSSQGGVLLQSGGTVYLQGAQVDAAKNIAITGGNVVVQAATNYSSLTGTHSSNDLNLGTGIWNATPGTGIKAKNTITTQVQDSTLARTTLNGENVSLTATDTLAMAGTTVNTQGTLALNAGTLLLGTQATEHSTQTTGKGRDLVYQKTRDNGASDQTLHYDQINAGTLAVNAHRIEAGLGARDSVQALAQQPGMGWVTQLQNDPKLNGKIDWAKVEEAHRQWNHGQQGLTPEGAAIVTLVVAYFTAGAASGIGAAAGETAAVAAGEVAAGSTVGAVVGGAVTAGISALASEAAVALINNQGDIGGALHDLGSSANVHNLLTAIVTGGVLGGLQMNPTGLPTAGGGVQGFGAQLGQNLTAGGARAVINTAINGGSLEGNLQAALKGAILDTVAAQAANAIGTATFGSDAVLNEFTNKVAHAIAGCAVGAARTGSAGSAGGCAAGALGAAIGELAAETYGRNPDTVQFAAMLSGIAVAIAGGDAGQINLGSQAGANAAANNFLSHQNVDQLQARLAKCATGNEVCITAAIESMRGISQANDALLLNCKATNNCAELTAAYRQGAGDLNTLISTGALGSDSNANRAFSLEARGFIDIANGLHNRIPAGCNLANPSGACIQQSRDFARGLATAGVGLVTIPLAFVGAATTGAVAAGMLSALTQTIDNGSANGGQVLVDAATGAITGVLVNGLFQGVSQVVTVAGSRVAQLLNSEGELVAVMPASRVGAVGVNGGVITGELTAVERTAAGAVENGQLATAPVGRSGSPMNVTAATNAPATIDGVNYSGHALDQMQGRGIVPSAVQNTINQGIVFPTGPGTTGYYDQVNNLRVIVNSTNGRVVTAIPGKP